MILENMLPLANFVKETFPTMTAGRPLTCNETNNYDAYTVFTLKRFPTIFEEKAIDHHEY